MTRLIKILVLNFFFFTAYILPLYASVLGNADVYKVTMRKIEFCTGSNDVTDCSDAVVVGSGDVQVDIAAVDAGAAAAAYGEPTLLPLGVTYTHMRVTVDRKFVIRNETAIAAGENATACRTIATTDTMYGAQTEASGKYTHKPVVGNNQTAANMNIYVISDQYTQCTGLTCAGVGGFNATKQGISYAQGTASSRHQSQHAEGDASNDHVLIYELAKPYTVSLVAPTIDIAFGTQNAVGAAEVNNLCQMWAEEPIVTITVE